MPPRTVVLKSQCAHARVCPASDDLEAPYGEVTTSSPSRRLTWDSAAGRSVRRDNAQGNLGLRTQRSTVIAFELAVCSRVGSEDSGS